MVPFWPTLHAIGIDRAPPPSDVIAFSVYDRSTF
jgi:hypothetical protein